MYKDLHRFVGIVFIEINARGYLAKQEAYNIEKTYADVEMKIPLGEATVYFTVRSYFNPIDARVEIVKLNVTYVDVMTFASIQGQVEQVLDALEYATDIFKESNENEGI